MEYPRIPIDIVVKGKYYPFSTTKKNETTVLFDSLGLGGAFGFEAEAMYNLGRSFGLNQFWFDFGFGMGIGGASGSNHYGSSYPTGKTKISMASNINWEFSLLKKFYLGRIALDLQAGFGLQTVMVETEKYTLLSTIDYYNRFINSGAGIFFNGNVELPLTSWCNLGLGGGYQIYGASKDWTQEMKAGLTGDWSKGSTYTDAEISHSGPTVHLFLTISPPALPFDPLDLLRGSIGL